MARSPSTPGSTPSRKSWSAEPGVTLRPTAAHKDLSNGRTQWPIRPRSSSSGSQAHAVSQGRRYPRQQPGISDGPTTVTRTTQTAARPRSSWAGSDQLGEPPRATHCQAGRWRRRPGGGLSGIIIVPVAATQADWRGRGLPVLPPGPWKSRYDWPPGRAGGLPRRPQPSESDSAIEAAGPRSRQGPGPPGPLAGPAPPPRPGPPWRLPPGCRQSRQDPGPGRRRDLYGHRERVAPARALPPV